MKAEGAQPFAFFVVLYPVTCTCHDLDREPRSCIFPCCPVGRARLFLPSLSAQVEVNSTLTPEQYVNDVLLGTGVEATNVQFTGSPMQIGEITGFDPAGFSHRGRPHSQHRGGQQPGQRGRWVCG